MSIDPSKISRSTQPAYEGVAKEKKTLEECATQISVHSKPLLLKEASLPNNSLLPNPNLQTEKAAVQNVFTPIKVQNSEIQQSIDNFKLKILQTAIQQETNTSPPKAEVPLKPQAALEKAMQALELIQHEANGSKTYSAAEYHKAAESLKDLQQHDPTISTTMLQLYEKSASKSLHSGDIKQAFITRADAAKAIEFSKSHPLNSMTQAIAAGAAKQIIPEFGAQFSSHDTGVLKGGAFSLRTRNITDESGITQQKDILNFELSHFARGDFETNLRELMALNEEDWRQVENNLPEGFANISCVVKDEYCYQSKNEQGNFSNESGLSLPSNSYEIEFTGIGKMTVGADAEYGGLYSEVKVEIASGLPEGEGLKKMQQMMSILGMGPVMGKQRPEDDDRKLSSLIFRTYFPKEALKIERTDKFYELSKQDLRNLMEKITEGETFNGYTIGDILDAYQENSNLCKKLEILPGKEVWTLDNLGDIMRENGVYGCIAGVGHFEDAISMMKTGLLSSKLRLESDYGVRGGVSKVDDIETGGNDKIFLRAVNGINSQNEVSKFPFTGEVQFIIDANVVNRGALMYFQDQYGVTNQHGGQDSKGFDRFGYYQERPNIASFSEYLSQPGVVDMHPDLGTYDRKVDFYKGARNEVCIPGGQISSNFIKGCMVQTEEIKNKLIEKLKNPEVALYKDGSLTFGIEKDGMHMVMGDRKIPIDDFIKISNQFQKEMWE